MLEDAKQWGGLMLLDDWRIILWALSTSGSLLKSSTRSFFKNFHRVCSTLFCN